MSPAVMHTHTHRIAPYTNSEQTENSPAAHTRKIMVVLAIIQEESH